jgi:2,4-dienoyl-CoA reductase-like NADH-dependent reductase (Old Yellow Enzyme family)/thioredoxin reductase
MNLIQRLIGRRQFLVAAGIGSASALTLGKLGGIVDPVFQTPSAMAAENESSSVTNEVSDRYSHILSPLKIGNVVLKNRLLMPPSTPHFLQGPENFPSEEVRSYYINLAKNGAAIVTVSINKNKSQRQMMNDIGHMAIYDLEDNGVLNYFDQLVEGIHLHGSKACAAVMVGMATMSGGAGAMPGMPSGAAGGMPDMPSGAAGGVPEMPSGAAGGMPGAATSQSGNTAANSQKMVEDALTQAKFYQSHGFDALIISTRGNQNANSSIIEACKTVKKAMPDMLIITEIFVREPSITQHTDDMYYQAGSNLDDAVKFAKQLEGAADIAMVRVADASYAHATTWNTIKGKPYSINYADAIKKSGAKIIVAPGGGYQDLDQIEGYIANGKTDMITMARAFVCDPEYGKKIFAGRGEDVVPCIKCNKCHGESNSGPWYSACSVNPKLGSSTSVRAIEAPGKPKKVAVVGGGPAGMKAAITAAERGHTVTLYEKNFYLGGLLHHSDYSPFKWAIKDFKDYLVKRLDRAGVKVLLNTAAAPETIKSKGYDTILVAVGADPVVAKIPGADVSSIYNIMDAYTREKSMGRNVVFIGGGEFGTDAGMHLAKAGHNVTMLTSAKELFPQNRPHYPETIVQTYKDLKNFSIITEAAVTIVSAGNVTYKDSKGETRSIQADSVVVYSGLKAKKDEALKFYGSAKQFFTIGDCSEKGGNILACMRSAFFTASQI